MQSWLHSNLAQVQNWRNEGISSANADSTKQVVLLISRYQKTCLNEGHPTVVCSAVALNLLFHIPIWAGVLITAADVMFILLFGTRSVRLLELLVATLILTITCCFAYELGKADPSWLEVAKGFIPKPNILTNSQVIHRFKYAFVVLSWAKVVEFLVYRRCLQPLVSWEQR